MVSLHQYAHRRERETIRGIAQRRRGLSVPVVFLPRSLGSPSLPPWAKSRPGGCPRACRRRGPAATNVVGVGGVSAPALGCTSGSPGCIGGPNPIHPGHHAPIDDRRFGGTAHVKSMMDSPCSLMQVLTEPRLTNKKPSDAAHSSTVQPLLFVVRKPHPVEWALKSPATSAGQTG